MSYTLKYILHFFNLRDFKPHKEKCLSLCIFMENEKMFLM